MIEIGGSGNLGSEWNVQNTRRNNLSSMYGQNMNYVTAVSSLGTDIEEELDHIGIELKFDEGYNPLDFDYDEDLMDANRSLWNSKNKEDALFQSSTGKMYTNINFEAGTYNIMSEKQYASSVGIDYKDDSDKPYDFIRFGNNVASFTDLVFAGAGDGKTNKIGVNLGQFNNIRWGSSVSFDIQDVNASSVESIRESVPQHILDKIESALAIYETGSEEYNAKFLEIAAELMDQEGYTQGNKVASPSEDTKAQNSSKFNVTRDSNGQVKMTINSKDKVKIDNVGTMTGSGVFSLGATTDGSNESVIQAGNRNADSNLNISIDKRVDNLEAYGQNVNAKFDDLAVTTYNVNWKVNNGTLDSTAGNGTMFLDVEGGNNRFDLKGNTYIIDENEDNNVFNWKGNTIRNK